MSLNLNTGISSLDDYKDPSIRPSRDPMRNMSRTFLANSDATGQLLGTLTQGMTALNAELKAINDVMTKLNAASASLSNDTDTTGQKMIFQRKTTNKDGATDAEKAGIAEVQKFSDDLAKYGATSSQFVPAFYNSTNGGWQVNAINKPAVESMNNTMRLSAETKSTQSQELQLRLNNLLQRMNAAIDNAGNATKGWKDVASRTIANY